ncbi:hypothetical protein BC1002_2999 [Paraburkholderia atlantica]|uniref:Uncharacterized protein n=1 Tax=Paraburkholderia atlantica TaxID=2654982 RepID=D5W6C3_PARAM|nr:hypothetical protein [Paraburkholderia atlantica]ADG17044.1 hypothetical protein BC1002_2999 [Paraburkholderia atlantica]
MTYAEADTEFFALIEKHMPQLTGTLGKTKFPNTYRAMLTFVIKINSLKTAMFDMVDSNNPYAFKLLFRCFSEHYLRFTYVFVRFASEKTDTAGDDYYSFCGAAEAMDYVSAVKAAEALLGNTLVGDMRNALTQLYPRTERMSARQIEAESGKFKYRAILRFLAETAPGMIAKGQPFLAQIVPAYALLSSFVHGGPYAEMEMSDFAKAEALEGCVQDADLVCLMAASVFAFTAAAISREVHDCRPVASELFAWIKRYSDR